MANENKKSPDKSTGQGAPRPDQGRQPQSQQGEQGQQGRQPQRQPQQGGQGQAGKDQDRQPMRQGQGQGVPEDPQSDRQRTGNRSDIEGELDTDRDDNQDIGQKGDTNRGR